MGSREQSRDEHLFLASLFASRRDAIAISYILEWSSEGAFYGDSVPQKRGRFADFRSNAQERS